MEEGSAKELIGILKKEHDLLCRLSVVMQQKTGVIARGDVARLEHILNEEQPLIMQIEQAENDRVNVLEKNQLSGMTLSQIAQRAKGASRDMLLSLLNSFTDVTAQIKVTNDLNEKMVKSRLEVYDVLAGIRNSAVYARGGKTDRTVETKSLMDQKI